MPYLMLAQRMCFASAAFVELISHQITFQVLDCLRLPLNGEHCSRWVRNIIGIHVRSSRNAQTRMVPAPMYGQEQYEDMPVTRAVHGLAMCTSLVWDVRSL